MIAVLVLLPLVLLGVAAVLAMVSVKRSTLSITAAGVEYRNYPQATQVVPLAKVRRFEETEAVGNFSGLRPATAVLVLTDGSRLPVRSMRAPDAGVGVDALNARVAALRGRD
jgi:hypothetical protein